MYSQKCTFPTLKRKKDFLLSSGFDLKFLMLLIVEFSIDKR